MTPESLKIQFSEILEKPITQIKKLSGGCSFPAFIVESDSETYFIKTNPQPTDVFKKEVSGLKQISQHSSLAPEVIYFDDHHLVLEFLESEPASDHFWQQLGKELAELHKKEQGQFGFFEDNWIGKATQSNLCDKDTTWVDFFWHHRLLYKIEQINQANPRTFSLEKIKSLKQSCYTLLKNHSCLPTPLHGDLWSGNILCGTNQTPRLIDPAFYYGDRETDLAMTECFGGFSPLFYEAYNSHFPLPSGYENRKHLYNLYHMLNHQFIFGGPYAATVDNIINDLTG